MRRRRSPTKAQDLLSESVEMLHRIFQYVDLFSRKTLREFGVSGPQIWALRTIDRAGVIRTGDLARRMHLHISTVTGIINRLSAVRLVTRLRSSADGRVTELRLTSRGKAILAKVPEPPRSKAHRGLQELSSRDLRSVHRTLLILAKAMDVEVRK